MIATIARPVSHMVQIFSCRLYSGERHVSSVYVYSLSSMWEVDEYLTAIGDLGRAVDLGLIKEEKVVGSNPLLQIGISPWKPAAQEPLNSPIVDSFGQEFCALLISPRIVDDKATLVLAEVNVRIIDVLGFGDVLTLLCGKLWVGN